MIIVLIIVLLVITHCWLINPDCPITSVLLMSLSMFSIWLIVGHLVPKCCYEMACYLHCLIVHCSLLSFFGYGYVWYCVVCFLVVCHLNCFHLECCLILHCGCVFCFAVAGFKNYFSMSSTGSVILCSSNWSQRYCLAVICVVFTCLLFLVISHPLFFMHIVYDLLLCLWSSLPTTVPWAHGPPSSHWIIIVDLIRIKS